MKTHIRRTLILAATTLLLLLSAASGSASAAGTTESCSWDHDTYATCEVTSCISDMNGDIECVTGEYCTHGGDSFPCPDIEKQRVTDFKVVAIDPPKPVLGLRAAIR